MTTAADEALVSLLERPLPDSVGPAYFRKLDGGYLLTNDAGGFMRLSAGDFVRFLSGAISSDEPLFDDLRREGFLRQGLVFDDLAGRWRKRNHWIESGPGLHLVHLTRRSRQGTPYVRNPPPAEAQGFDMSPATARRLSRLIFDGPASELTVEIRGGDPLLNWEALSYLSWNLSSFAGAVKRALSLAVVSPLTELDGEKADFLTSHSFRFAVPLDGPEDIHESARPAMGGGWKKTADGIRALLERSAGSVQAYCTVTRDSLGREREIISVYRELGLNSIFLRPLWKVGDASRHWGQVGVSADEYLEFRRRIVEEAMALERSGIPFFERGTALFANKILEGADPGDCEARLLYGGGISELAYEFDGGVYPSDEARALAELGATASFRLGALTLSSRQVADHPTVRVLAASSCLEAHSLCSRCAYKPYCGRSPFRDLAEQGSLHGRGESASCRIRKGIQDAVFRGVEDSFAESVLRRWARAVRWEVGTPPPPFLSGGIL